MGGLKRMESPFLFDNYDKLEGVYSKLRPRISNGMLFY